MLYYIYYKTSGGSVMAKEIIGIQLDVSNMTTEELLKIQNELIKNLTEVKFQLRMRKMAESRHSSYKY